MRGTLAPRCVHLGLIVHKLMALSIITASIEAIQPETVCGGVPTLQGFDFPEGASQPSDAGAVLIHPLQCWKGIVASPSRTDGGPRRTFSKDMAQYLFPSSPLSSADGNPTLIPTSQLLSPSIRHTFLIRTPSKAIPSYHRLCHPGSATGFEYFDPSEAGYRELRLLFDFLRTQGVDPLVIESDDLLKEPTKVMRGWCESVGIQFDEGMLEWNEGTREHL
jgi:hypothetical protein